MLRLYARYSYVPKLNSGNTVTICLQNEDDLKNEVDLKNEDDLNNEDDLKTEDNIKNEDDLKNGDKVCTQFKLDEIKTRYGFYTVTNRH